MSDTESDRRVGKEPARDESGGAHDDNDGADQGTADEAPRRRRGITRRRLLLGAAAGAGLLAVGARIALDRGRPWLAQQVLERGTGAPDLPEALVWFELTAEHITLFVPKIEMGQGIHTALAQIACEDLALDPTHLRVVQADTARGFATNAQFTFGSTSVATLYTPLREAAAAVRMMLAGEAAARLGVAATALTAASGRFTAGGRGVTYGELVAAKQGPWQLPEQPPPLRPVGEFRRIGGEFERVDMRAKLTGQAVYSYDARVEGMRYGAVARPPRFGATLSAARPGRTQTRPGVTAIIDVEAGFAGVVAPTRTQAWAALADLELEWTGGTDADSAALDAALPADGGSVVRRHGDLGEALEQGTLVEAAYRTPLAHHAHLEPVAALVAIRPAAGDGATKRVEAWVGTQSPGAAAEALREFLGDDHEVTVHPTLLGGSFGRKGSQDAALEAARLARAVGAPVHVGWSRTEDLRHGVYRPPTHTRLRGTVRDGRIVGVEQHSASGDIIWAVAGLPEFVRDTLGFDPGTLLGQFLPYTMSAYRVVNQREQLPVPTGPWRGLGVFPNIFALESFVDELAAAAGADPLQFRLDNLPDDAAGRRLRAVLTRAAAEAGWSTGAFAGTPHSGSGGITAGLRSRPALGIACCLDHDTAVAMAAQVALRGGQIEVQRVVVAVDPGLVINPAGARLQAVGSVVMGLSSTLVERLDVAAGAVTQANFDDYPILTMARTPPIDVHLVASDDRPRGMGEPVMGPVAAAVANAVYAASGQRLRTLPLQPGQQPT